MGGHVRQCREGNVKERIKNEKYGHTNVKMGSASSRRTFLKAGVATAGAALLGAAAKSTAATAADQTKETVEEAQLLFVQNSRDVNLVKSKMTLEGIGPTTIFFSDRPKRIAGHMDTE